jgi:hypothetical protein
MARAKRSRRRTVRSVKARRARPSGSARPTPQSRRVARARVKRAAKRVLVSAKRVAGTLVRAGAVTGRAALARGTRVTARSAGRGGKRAAGAAQTAIESLADRIAP